MKAVLLASTVDKQTKDRRQARCMIYSYTYKMSSKRDTNARTIMTFVALRVAVNPQTALEW